MPIKAFVQSVPENVCAKKVGSGAGSMGKEVWRVVALLGYTSNLHLIRGTGWNGQGGTHPSRALRKQFVITTTILSVE
jgi:hypothetical protein